MTSRRANMGIGDYMCVTLRGGAPWGFTLKEGAGETYRPLLVSQVEEGGPASLAGVKDGDEMVSLNGEPCADLTLSQAVDVVDASADCLQLLIRRYCSISAEEEESEEMCSGQDSDATIESTTLHIFSSEQRCPSPKELLIPASLDEAYYDLHSDRAASKAPELLCTQLHVSPPPDQRGEEPDQERCFSPGDLVELQVSLSEQTSSEVGCASLGSALGILGDPSDTEAANVVHNTSTGVLQLDLRKPLKQLGVVVGSPQGPGGAEGAQEHLQGSEGRGMARGGGPEVSGHAGSLSEGGGGGGGCEGDPRAFSVSFGIPSDDGTPAEEQDSDSEGDPDKPHKHHARHSRLRRCESLSEKQVKEAKSKCKRIALLLTTAPSNPNNKGVLMFKKHRQRAKKYTLVSYGTGEDEPESSDEEDGGVGEPCTVELTLVATSDPEIDKHFQTNSKSVLAVTLDKGLLEIERNLNNQAEMECLPETKGKGAVMFAQRRQRMDEIAAEHEELRRHGIPVEGIQEAEKNLAEQSYLQSAAESHTYMDVSAHQQSQQQYQQYYEQQQYQQQQQQQQQQRLYEQQHLQQQQMFQQQQAFHQEQQMQHYAANINGTVQHQTSEMQTTFSNRTAKPFSVENMAAVPYSPPASGFNQDSFGHGEHIASRDERIATPAIKTGVLMEGRKRNTAKPMFTFKEHPKVSPNPALLNLLNKSDKKLGFESGPEEDYLSLGAEACNFLQSSLKNKNPPPVAPKPAVNPSCLPWSPQPELANQAVAQPENSVSTPAVVPTAESAPAPELETTPAPVAEPSPPPAPQGVPVSTTMDPHTLTLPEPEPQEQSLQVATEDENVAAGLSQPAPQTTWAASQVQTQQQPSSQSWHQVQPQEVAASQSPSQPPWTARQSPQAQVQPPTLTTTWSPQNQLSWNPPVEQAQPPTHAHPTWGHPQEQRQAQPPWAQPQPPNMQPTPPAWGQPQDQQVQKQPPQAPWVEPPQAQPPPHQPPWIQPQQKVQAQPPWGQLQPEVQQQPPWVQQHQAPQQEWAPAQGPGQPQQPWMSAQCQQPQQPSMNAWTPSQTQAQIQPPWTQPTQAQVPVGPEANVNPWAPVPAKAQPPWAQSSALPGQQSTPQTQQQAPWAQPVSPQMTPQPNWLEPNSRPSQQPPMSTWASAQTPPQAAVNTWTPQLQRAPANVSTSVVNTRPSPKPWTPLQNAPQSQSHPPPPQRMHSYTIAQRASPINPMATVLNPSSQSSPLNLPAVRGKGADMFVKRQSRMEKFVVDSETVEANKASRSTSPAASLPNEWKYTPNVRAPPSRAYNPIQSPFYPPAATKQPPSSGPSTKAKNKGKQKETPPPKPLNVVDVMKHQPYQLNSSLFIFGAPVETEKPKAAPSPPDPPVENQQVRYEQMPPVQAGGPYNVPCSQAAFGIPMQPTMHDGHYQPNPPDMYPPPNPYQPAPVPYQQAYDQQYQQPIPPAYSPQTPQGSTYQHPPQAPYQPANSPPYLATPSLPFQPQPPSSYAGPNVALAAKAESVSGASTAPKPKFTAKKSSAQIWKPAAVDKE